MFIIKNISIPFIISCSLLIFAPVYGMGEKDAVKADSHAEWQDVQTKGAVKIEELRIDLNRCANDPKSLPVVYRRNKNEYIATIASLIDEIRVLLNSNEIEYRGIRNGNSYVYRSPAITDQDTKKNIKNINSRIRKIDMKIKQIDFASKRLEKLGYCSFEEDKDKVDTTGLQAVTDMPDLVLAEEPCESTRMQKHTSGNNHCGTTKGVGNIATDIAEIDAAMQPASATCTTSNTPVSTENTPAVNEIKNETCPITGNPTNESSPTVDLLDGRNGKTYRARICCPDCADKLKEAWEDNDSTFRDKLINHRKISKSSIKIPSEHHHNHATEIKEKEEEYSPPPEPKKTDARVNDKPIVLPAVTDSTENSAIRQTRNDLNKDGRYLTLIRLTYTSQIDDANKKALVILTEDGPYGEKSPYINTNQEIRIWDDLARGYAKRIEKNPGDPNNASLEAAEKELRLIAVASGKPVYGEHYANKAVLRDKFRLSEDQISSLSQKYKNPQERIGYLSSLATGEKSVPYKVPAESIGEKLETISRQIETENVPHNTQHSLATHDHSTHAAAHDNSAAHATTGDKHAPVSEQELQEQQRKIDQARAHHYQHERGEEDFMSILSNMRNNASTYSVDDFIKNADKALAKAVSSKTPAELTIFDNNVPSIANDILYNHNGKQKSKTDLEKLLATLRRYQARPNSKSNYSGVISSVEIEIKRIGEKPENISRQTETENAQHSPVTHDHSAHATTGDEHHPAPVTAVPTAGSTHNEAVTVENETCPILVDEPTDGKSLTVDLEHNGRIYKVRVCCSGCVDKLKKKWADNAGGFRDAVISKKLAIRPAGGSGAPDQSGHRHHSHTH